MSITIRLATIGVLMAGCAKDPGAVEPAAKAKTKTPAVYGAMCKQGPTAFGDVLLPIAGDLQAQEIWYSQSGDHTDCSGVFHRVLEAYQGQCPNEVLPTYDVDRTSRMLGAWYLNKGLLTVVSDPVAQASLIAPGSVLFFGPNGPKYASMDPAKAMEDIRHVGVVVGVTYDATGALESYALFHGRRTGTYAAITNDQRVSGKPPFGNGPDAIIGISPIATPLAPPSAAPKPRSSATKAEPGALTCGGKVVSAPRRVPAIVNGLLEDKVKVHGDDPADRVRVFTLVAEEMAEQCPQLAVPPKDARDTYEHLAQWFYTGGQFKVVDQAASRGDWIVAGMVMFYGPASVDYAGMDPEDVVNHIDHVGVVRRVIRENGVVTGYELFHGPPDQGGVATVTPANAQGAALPFGLEGRAWLGVAPMFTRTKAEN